MTIHDLLGQICRRSAAAVIAQSGLRHPALIARLRDQLSAEPGTKGSFLADPVLEGSFGWAAAPETMTDLIGLLDPALVDALDAKEPVPPGRDERYRFGRDWHPHAHQVTAWRTLLGPTPRSVLVSSGTGSGKTECFMVPILEDLLRLGRNEGRLQGTRALMLYPLNALIASQRDRLHDWTAPFGDRMRFALYNGETPEQWSVSAARARPNEVLDRTTLRADTPPILVTNITMLEYMLIRNIDAPILDRSRGKLRWIILDEAHSYIGSQAAELALLLRRVMQAFGVRPDEVRFVATSATIGQGDAVAKQLQRFLADVSGAMPDRISFIEGTRETRLASPLAGMEESPKNALDALFNDGHALDLRKALVSRPGMTLTEATRVTLGNTGTTRDTLILAEASAHAKQGGQRLLPLRLHLVHRAQPGVWVCPNADCRGREGTELADPSWPWGAVEVLERDRCPHCNTPLFELAACSECGAPHLLAEQSSDGCLRRPTRPERDDEFAQGIDRQEDDDEEVGAGTRAAELRTIVDPAAREAAAVRNGDASDWTVAFDPATGRLADRAGDATLKLRLSDAVDCWSCKSTTRGGTALRRVRFGAPFLLGNVLPQVLERMPERSGDLPSGGRQLITFTDSRQGTARFAARIQQDAERTFARAALYHAVQEGRASEADRRVMDALQNVIAQLQPLATSSPQLAAILEAKVGELEALRVRAGSALPWDEAMAMMADQADLRYLQEEVWNFRDVSFAKPGALARIFMVREFFRRPRRANSAETLGLVRLRYPAIERLDLASVPNAFLRYGGTLAEWKSFLYLIETFMLRSRSIVAVEGNDIRWLGMRVRPRVVRRPGAEEDGDRYLLNWPSIHQGRSERVAITKLLLTGLKLDSSRPDHADDANECLNAAYSALLPVMKEARGGFQLDLTRCEVARLDEGWLCPVTNQILPETFRGLTPWQPQGSRVETEPCRALQMPRLPQTWPRSRDSRSTLEAWLDSDPAVVALRGDGVWRDLQDRAALLAPVFLIAEHSAQQPGWKLRWFEREFKQGRLNVLSCSTTMEMGVDIGGLGGVINTNVPPSPANYRQRVGRAGRRGEAIALALTFARDEPFGWTTYADPLGPLVATIRPPSVSLDSVPIVQRHVNAFLLGIFIRIDGRTDLHRLKTGEFFGRDDAGGASANDPASRFAEWCRSSDAIPRETIDGLRRLVRGTILETATYLCERAATAMSTAAEGWREEWASLARDLGSLEGAAKVRIRMQMKRLCGSFVLGELAGRGFLPGYGFPTDVVEFLIPESHDARRDGTEERGENRFRRMESPSRSLDLAIRDYAPGSEVVLDGLVYRSAGVTLNWKRPASAEERAPQSLRFAWRCRNCDASGDSPASPVQCAECGSEDLLRIEYLRPAGFTFDVGDTRRLPHTDVTRIDYVEPTPPFVSASGAPWVTLPHPDAGRMRAAAGGSILFRADGAEGAGFAVCLHCGRAAAETRRPEPGEAVATLPVEMIDHIPLRGARNGGPCPGNAAGFGVKRNLALGHSTRTDVFELQLEALSTRSSEHGALSVAVALREALVRRLGIESREVGFSVSPRRSNGRNCWTILLFDQASGGAGFATQAAEMLPELVAAAGKILDCRSEGCLTACPACILCADSRFDATKLDRKEAFRIIDELRRLLDVPAVYRVFAGAMTEPKPVLDALRVGLGTGPLSLFFGGDPLDWDPATWAGRDLLERARSRGAAVRLVAPAQSWSVLTTPQRLYVQALAQLPGVTLHHQKEPILRGPLHVIAALGEGDEARVWGFESQAPLVFGPEWGQAAGSPLIRGLACPPKIGPTLAVTEITPALGAEIRRIEIGRELDGPISSFGGNFWKILEKGCPDLRLCWKIGAPMAITYTDRYLVSPLPTRLLLEVLRKIPCGVSVPVTVRTQIDAPPRDRQPWYLADDWQAAEVRRAVVQQALVGVGLDARVDLAAKRDLPHDRSLVLSWADGTRVEIGLDQGFGYWVTDRQQVFDFTASKAAQAENIISARFAVMGRPHGRTILLIGYTAEIVRNQ